MDNIKTWTGLSVEESIRTTEDRNKWRKYVHGVANPRVEDGYRTELNRTFSCRFMIIYGRDSVLLRCTSSFVDAVVSSPAKHIPLTGHKPPTYLEGAGHAN